MRVRVRERTQPFASPADRTLMPDSPPPRLDYENLDVHRCAIEFLRLALRVASALPRGESELRSQLKTAAMSVPLTIAEGTGKPSPADRAHAHAIARGSAMECGAIVDVCAIAGYISAADARHGKDLLVRTVAMLSKMSR
jgi:four helix bundle protein